MSTLEQHEQHEERRGGAAQRARHAARRAAVLEDLAWLREGGTPDPEIPARLGMSAAALARLLYRLDRPEDARPFAAEANRLRGKRPRDLAKHREHVRAWRVRQRQARRVTPSTTRGDA